jgi:antitoxin CcdA
MTSSAKRKVSITLDADLVAALEAEGGTTLFTKCKRQLALADLLAHLAEERGRLDTPEDEAEIARYMRLLGGVADEPGGLRATDETGTGH